MQPESTYLKSQKLLKTYFIIGLAVWSAVLAAALFYNVQAEKQSSIKQAKNTAVATMNKDLAFRSWAAKHGGVYVLVDKDTQPNEYLQAPNRDINTTAGVLTLMNPAFMLRQMIDWQEFKYGVKTRISSTNPTRPQNKSDDWERAVLERFNSDPTDYFEIVQQGGGLKLRAMKAFVTEKPCLKCHAVQGYKEGDIRGGISATVDLSPYMSQVDAKIGGLAVSYGLIWLLGIFGAAFSYRHIAKYMRQLQISGQELEKSEGRFRALNDNLEHLVEQQSAKLMEREMLISSIFFNSSIAIAVCDKNFKISQTNKAFEHLVGYKKNSLIGTSFFIFTHSLDANKERHYIDEFKSHKNGVVRYGKRLLKEDATVVTVNVGISAVKSFKDEDSGFILAMIEDVTKQSLLEEKQKSQQQMLIQQSKMAAMGEMLGAIAHQWRQPLNALGLIIQDVPDALRYEELTPEYAKSLVEKGMNQIAYMSKTIEDFRNFFRPDKEQKPFDVFGALRSVAALTQAQMKNSNIEVYFHCDGEIFTDALSCESCARCSVSVNGLENEFKQAVLNIMSNAKDAILSKRLSGRMDDSKEWRVDIFVEYDDKIVTVRIEDNAGGIEPQNMDKIFEPYFTTKKEEGTGIGLYMTKTIIEDSLHGKIYVQNTPDGASFTIELGR